MFYSSFSAGTVPLWASSVILSPSALAPAAAHVHTQAEPTFPGVVSWGLAASTRPCCNCFTPLPLPTTTPVPPDQIAGPTPRRGRFRCLFVQFERLFLRYVRSYGGPPRCTGGGSWVESKGVGWWRCWSWECRVISIVCCDWNGGGWSPGWRMMYIE